MRYFMRQRGGDVVRRSPIGLGQRLRARRTYADVFELKLLGQVGRQQQDFGHDVNQGDRGQLMHLAVEE